jgi:putative hydrolase of the HAD superfamily
MPVAKPHEEAFTSIAAVLGVRPVECVFVGDRLWDDILGSQQAGMRAILIPHSVLPSIQVPDDSAVPDAVAQRLSDVLTIVRAWHDGAPSTA